MGVWGRGGHAGTPTPTPQQEERPRGPRAGSCPARSLLKAAGPGPQASGESGSAPSLPLGLRPV